MLRVWHTASGRKTCCAVLHSLALSHCCLRLLSGTRSVGRRRKRNARQSSRRRSAKRLLPMASAAAAGEWCLSFMSQLQSVGHWSRADTQLRPSIMLGARICTQSHVCMEEQVCQTNIQGSTVHFAVRFERTCFVGTVGPTGRVSAIRPASHFSTSAGRCRGWGGSVRLGQAIWT